MLEEHPMIFTGAPSMPTKASPKDTHVPITAQKYYSFLKEKFNAEIKKIDQIISG